MGWPVGRTNMQPAAAATAAPAASSSKQQEAVSQPADSQVVLRGIALLYESPAETRLTVYRRSQHGVRTLLWFVNLCGLSGEIDFRRFDSLS